ncbi:MAG: YidC/Oxa1 family membrane protein insertase [bacterium]
MSNIFTVILYQPIYNLLVFFYNIVPGHDIGIAIIILTVVIKIILWPFAGKSLKSQKALQNIQPKIDELRKKYKDQKEKMTQEMMRLYKEEKVNPLSSCLPLLIQFPFLIAVFQVFRTGLSSDAGLNLLYPFVANPGHLNAVAFNFLDLSQKNIYLAILAGLAQFWQAKMMMTKKPAVQSAGSKDENMMASMNKQMVYIMPVVTIWIGFSLPSGLMLYWLVTTILMVGQQYLIFNRKNKEVKVGETIKQ